MLRDAGRARYDVTYDAALDVVTEWAAVIDGAVVQRTALAHLTAVSSEGLAMWLAKRGGRAYGRRTRLP